MSNTKNNNSNIQWQRMRIDQAQRSAMKQQRPLCIWLTGLSGAGKSTLANLLEQQLHALGQHTYLLDGDNVRHGLCADLGFTHADRSENVRRVAHVARLIASVQAGHSRKAACSSLRTGNYPIKNKLAK